MVSHFGPGIDGKIMRDLLPKVSGLCAGRYLNREGNMSKDIALLDRRVDIEDDLNYAENYKISEKALAELQKHDAIANPYLNAAARIVTRFVSSVFFRNRKEKLRSIDYLPRSMDYLQPREDGEYTRADEQFIFTLADLDFSLAPHVELTSNQKEWCNSVWVQERRTVNDDDLLEHICSMQDVHVHLNTCRWSERAWSLQTWGRDEKPFCMSLNQAIRENKNTNDTATRVSESYEEWDIDVAWHVAHEVIWQCDYDNDGYWRYIENNFDGSEERFNKWVREEYEMDSPQSKAWGTPEEMEMFSSEKEYYEYLDDMMDEQDRALEDAKFRMDNDW